MTAMQKVLRSTMLAAWLMALAQSSLPQDCDGAFFSPDDYDNQQPLARPHPEFARTLLSAKRGNAVEQRNLAVSFEAGYLVSPCPQAAEYWYSKAALAGDEIAKKWADRHAQFARLGGGAECTEEQCSGNLAGLPRQVTLLVGQDGHYYAPVTINGVTIMGVVDTGASNVSMGPQTARSFGVVLTSAQRETLQTANGAVAVQSTILPSVSVNGIVVRDVRVSVGQSEHPLLIGMSFLKRVDFQQDDGKLVLTKR